MGYLSHRKTDAGCIIVGERTNWRREIIPNSGVCINRDHYRVTDGMARGDPGCAVIHVKVGTHNMAHHRIDVWFKGPDGFVWWGVDLGNGPRCRRTKESWIDRVMTAA